MGSLRPQNTRGFTIMELVIVIAIIGVLVGISVPLVGAAIDNARRDHDIACVEAAVAAAKAEYAYEFDGENNMTRIYAFNAATGEAMPAKTTAGYGQWDQDANYSVAGKNVGGVAKDTFVTCGIKAGIVTILHWGEHQTWESTVSGLGTTTNSSSGGYSENAQLREQVISIENSKRIQVDQQIVKSFSEYFVGKTDNELRGILGVGKKYEAAIKNGSLLLQYRIDSTSNSIRIGYPAQGTGYLAAIGYPTTTTKGTPVADVINNYMSKYLFVSDEMIEIGVERAVKVKVTRDGNGKCVACRVWVEGVDYLDSDAIDSNIVD